MSVGPKARLSPAASVRASTVLCWAGKESLAAGAKSAQGQGLAGVPVESCWAHALDMRTWATRALAGMKRAWAVMRAPAMRRATAERERVEMVVRFPLPRLRGRGAGVGVVGR